jgi:hypothetical protein
MEKTLTNEQKARILAVYLGCETNYGKLVGVCNWAAYTEMNDGTIQSGSLENLSLSLTPLSAISDKHINDVADIINVRTDKGLKDMGIPFTRKGFVLEWLLKENNFTTTNIWKHNLAFQYLIQKGYAVPTFIEVGHPLNGKTPIELGIAIDSTTINQQP